MLEEKYNKEEEVEAAFKDYIRLVKSNAVIMAKTMIERGYEIVSGGTENHLMLVSLIARGMTGKAADAALGRANITVNKNSVPNDPQSPFVTSGLRLGTPAITTRGFGNEDVAHLTNLVCDVLDDLDDEAVIAKVQAQALELCRKFPVYGD